MPKLARFRLVRQQQGELRASVVERDSVAEPSTTTFELSSGGALRVELAVGHEHSRLELFVDKRQSDLR